MATVQNVTRCRVHVEIEGVVSETERAREFWQVHRPGEMLVQELVQNVSFIPGFVWS